MEKVSAPSQFHGTKKAAMILLINAAAQDSKQFNL
jgi:hypothetical protein